MKTKWNKFVETLKFTFDKVEIDKIQLINKLHERTH